MPNVFGIVLAGGEGKRLTPLTARPRQAGGAVRRQLPADRLRAVEPRQRRLPPDRRAHAVQEPLARPPHRARRGGCRRCSATTSRRCRRRCGAGRTGSPARPTRSTRTSTCSTTSGPTTSPCSAPTTSTGWTRARCSTSTSRRGAAVTVAALRAPLVAGRPVRRRSRPAPTGTRSPRSARSPRTPSGLPDAPDQVFASMGNYLFTTDALIEAVHRRRRAPTSPATTWAATSCRCWSSSGAAHVYDFSRNVVPGESERDHGYWRDVGTLDAYYDAHMDLISVHPVFNLYNSEWPILTWHDPLPPAKFVFDEDGPARPRARLDGVRGRGDLGRDGAAVGALAGRARALVRRGRGLGADAGRRRRPQRGRAARDPRQERARGAGRARSASTRRRTASAVHGLRRRRDVVVGKGEVVKA